MAPILPRFVMALSLGLAMQAAVAGDRTYRWTDAQGRVHYSDVKNDKSVPVQIKPSGGVAATPKDSAATLAARQLECQRRKDQLTLYNNSADISETDNLGNTRSYTAEERNKLIERAREQAKTACSQPGLPPEAAVADAGG